jgi:hypothetical protein
MASISFIEILLSFIDLFIASYANSGKDLSRFPNLVLPTPVINIENHLPLLLYFYRHKEYLRDVNNFRVFYLPRYFLTGYRLETN